MLGGLLPRGASVVGCSDVRDWGSAYFGSVYSRKSGVDDFGVLVERTGGCSCSLKFVSLSCGGMSDAAKSYISEIW